MIISALLLIGFLCFVNTGSAQEPGFHRRVKEGHHKLESVLARLEKEHGKGPIFSERFARERRVKIDDQDRITVFLLREKGKKIDVGSLKALGAEIIKRTEDVIQASVPIAMLSALADAVEGVSFIKLPDRPVPLTSSQGVSLTYAPNYFSSGYDGSGVKVAVIDVGFAGLFPATFAGELPPDVTKVDCTDRDCVFATFGSETVEHGTAVAEIIYDMAPGAQLYLMKIDTMLDLVTAKDYCIANGIKIINHSVGWYNTNFYNGACYNSNPVCVANDDHANGILWVNAAGNAADLHYAGVFTDVNGDLLNDQSVILTASGGVIEAFMTWDAWPATNQDYDLFLLDSSFNIVDSSLTRQTGTRTPTERIYYPVPGTETGTYYLQVKKVSATSNHRFEVFSNRPLSPRVSSGSITAPADAAKVIAVGAIDYGEWLGGQQESFSSQGPTNDGRTKPEICGPDGVASYTIGSFYGTSAAAPHVAGAAALILSKNPGYSVSQLWTALTRSAVDMGNPGQDNFYGYGRLSVPSTFLDVSFGHWAHDYVTALYESGITGGCSADPLLFCPDRGITRAEMAVFLETSLGHPPEACGETLFTDVNSATVGSAFCGFIETLAADGITDGCTSTRFCPSDTISRAQAAVFIEAALGNPPNACTESFLDVNAASVGPAFCGFIERLAADGITGGCGGGNFCPDDPVSRAQMAVFLSAAPPPLTP
jgi:subtilisin family serine protease